MDIRPKDIWASEEKGRIWIDHVPNKAKVGDPLSNSTVQSLNAFLDEFEKRADDFNTILEVGAGNGRLIGTVAQAYLRKRCYSVDINAYMSEYVRKHYIVTTKVGDVAQLPYKDDSMDLVYTFQVLQHVAPEEIHQALSELLRVAKKEVWLMEGYDYRSMNRENGEMTHTADGGSFEYYYDHMELLDVYESYFLRSKDCEMRDVKIYKIRKE
jgi:ubiquinone/menaquinone biosynthesis C-methylase UbiE